MKTSFVDGRDPHMRHSVWHAADLFVSPSDSIQETFGLAVLEAMACGLPVVASDWDGYRDIVDDGQTGLPGADRDGERGHRLGHGPAACSASSPTIISSPNAPRRRPSTRRR